MKTKTLFLLIVLSPLFLLSQNNDTLVNKIKSNSVYFELLGNGVVFSLNYEKILINKRNNLGIRFGFGFSPEDEIRDIFTIPIELIVIFGNKKHHLELGIGSSFYSVIIKPQNQRKYMNYSMMFFGRIGYRYTAIKGFLFRVGFTPVVEIPGLLFDKPFHLHGGISIGYSF